MPRLIEKATGKSWEIPSNEFEAALASDLYDVPEGETARVVDKQTGLAGDVAATELTKYREATGVHAQSDAEFRADENDARIDREHGGALGAAGAFLESGADAVTLGGYGAATRLLLPDSYTENRRERAQANPVPSTLGTVVGSVAPVALSGGGGAAAAAARATPAGLAARVGVRTAERLGGGIRGAAAGYAAEGALVGFGQGVHEVALEDDIDPERAAGTISSNVLFGAGTGGALGGGGAVASRIAARAVNKGKELVEVARARAAVADDLRSLDHAGLRAEREKVLAELGVERVTHKAAVADEIADYYKSFEQANPFLVAEGSPRAVLTGSKNRLRSILDEPVGLRENPRKALDALRRNATGLERAIAAAPETAERLAAQETKLASELALELDTLPAAAAGVKLEGKLAQRYADFTGIRLKKGAMVAPDEAARFRAALEAGEVQGARAAALPKLQETLDQNLALQKKITGLDTPLESPRLTAIDDAKDALAGASKRGALESGATGYAITAATGLLPGGPVGVIGAMLAPKLIRKAADLVMGRLGKATAAQAERTKAALDAFMNVGGKLAKPTPVLATKVLASLSYGPPERRKQRGEGEPPKRKATLASAYQAREREILSHVTVGPEGRIVMRPAARRALGERLAGVRAASPLAADRIETVAARRLEFLASKLPKRPDIAAMAPGPDRWQPSDMEMRAFARFAAAAEDPGGVEERLAHGNVTPEDAEAYRTVYPERFEALKRSIVERLPELRATLPRERRLAMSIFTGIPVDPALHPAVLRILQTTFAAEPGTDGGTVPARAQPNFGPLGSMRKEDPTPAQESAG